MSAELKPCPDVIAWAEKDDDEWLIHNADSQLGQYIAKYQKEHHYKTLFPVFAARDDDADVWELVGFWKEQARQAEEARRSINDEYLPKYQAALNELRELKATRAPEPLLAEVREAIDRFLADYDDGDRADIGCSALAEAHVADFRALLTRLDAARE